MYLCGKNLASISNCDLSALNLWLMAKLWILEKWSKKDFWGAIRLFICFGSSHCDNVSHKRWRNVEVSNFRDIEHSVFSEGWIAKEKAGSNSTSQAFKIILANQIKKIFWNLTRDTWNNSIYPPRWVHGRAWTGPDTLFRDNCVIGLS